MALFAGPLLAKSYRLRNQRGTDSSSVATLPALDDCGISRSLEEWKTDQTFLLLFPGEEIQPYAGAMAAKPL